MRRANVKAALLGLHCAMAVTTSMMDTRGGISSVFRMFLISFAFFLKSVASCGRMSAIAGEVK